MQAIATFKFAWSVRGGGDDGHSAACASSAVLRNSRCVTPPHISDFRSAAITKAVQGLPHGLVLENIHFELAIMIYS